MIALMNHKQNHSPLTSALKSDTYE